MGIAVSIGGTSAAYLVISYIKLGELNQNAKLFVNSWRQGGKAGIVAPNERKLMKKYIRSCRLLGIELGSFGHYQKPTSIRIVGKLVIYTVKFLMMASKLF
jgi:hypothetical protein